MPVMADPPLAKPRRNRNTDAPSSSPGPAGAAASWPGCGDVRQVAVGDQPGAGDDDQRGHADQEPVGGNGEHPARFAEAAQVAEGEEHDEDHRQQGGRHREAGKAEMMASTPAAMETATVSV